MDGAVTREEATARWRRDLEAAEADSRQSWPMDITARMSEFERLTLITEILMPVRNELPLGFGETRQREQPSRLPTGEQYQEKGNERCPREPGRRQQSAGDAYRQDGFAGFSAIQAA